MLIGALAKKKKKVCAWGIFLPVAHSKIIAIQFFSGYNEEKE